MGKAQREKGKRGERATANEIAAKFGIDAHRGQQSRDGSDAPDVVGLTGWWIEVKTGKRLQPKAALEQADAARRPNDVPVAVLRYDREKAMAIMFWEDLLHLMDTAGVAK
ncbi:MAG: hypothetical protein EBR30_27850 [Cytophagia bacterium]|jgi:hypothetical protein|nr:hypothetical protein [Cytophagia bacterium]